MSNITSGIARGRDGSMFWSVRSPDSFANGARYSWEVSILDTIFERTIACGGADNQDAAKASVFAILRLMGAPNEDTKENR